MTTEEEQLKADQEAKFREIIREETGTVVEEKVKGILSEFFETIQKPAESENGEPPAAKEDFLDKMLTFLKTV